MALSQCISRFVPLLLILVGFGVSGNPALVNSRVNAPRSRLRAYGRQLDSAADTHAFSSLNTVKNKVVSHSPWNYPDFPVLATSHVVPSALFKEHSFLAIKDTKLIVSLIHVYRLPVRGPPLSRFS